MLRWWGGGGLRGAGLGVCWSEIIIRGVHRVTPQLMEAVLVWGGCDELPTVSL